MLGGRGIELVTKLHEREFAEMVATYGELYVHPDAGAESATVIVPDGRSAAMGLGFTSAALPLHTDRSSLDIPPRILAIYIRRSDGGGGGIPLFADLHLALATIDDKELLQVSISDLQGTRSLPLLMATEPRAFRYRDDNYWSPQGPREIVEEIRRRVVAVTVEIGWLKSGDGYLIDNHRFVHGRTAILRADRTVVRYLVDTPK